MHFQVIGGRNITGNFTEQWACIINILKVLALYLTVKASKSKHGCLYTFNKQSFFKQWKIT